MKTVILIFLTSSVGFPQARQDTSHLEAFSNVFFAWRALQQPCGPDDIPRVQRPSGWVPRYGKEDLKYYRQFIQDARIKLKTYEGHLTSKKDSLTYLLLRSALERVHWELNVLKQPYRNPDFYVYQTLGAVYELLLQSSPMTNERVEEIIVRLNSIPLTLAHARQNLSDPVRGFAEIAVDHLADIKSKMDECLAGLKPVCHRGYHEQLESSFKSAVSALEDYRAWLTARLPTMNNNFAVGRENYNYFLKRVALLPFSPDEVILQGQQEWNRAVAFETMEVHRNRKEREDKIFGSITEQIEQTRKDEIAVRRYLEQNEIMRIPAYIGHYTHRPIPAYLKPLTYLGVPDDLTSEFRTGDDGVHYIPPPSENLPFFYKATAHDPRPIIVHEGIPGHFFQLSLSWQNPDPLRRRYFDSGANEGVAFYVEEMLLQLGLFDNAPRTKEIIYRFMRLRALRVEVDVKLACGDFTIKEAAAYLERTVPMDHETALSEAVYFAYNPGQAISYQIGKNQVLRFLSDARLSKKGDFRLADFHDYLMMNGNVPIALLRWEYTGLDDDIKKLWN